MESIINKLILQLRVEEMEKIKTTYGMVVMIVKIIEKVHSKKNLSYQDSKRLTGLVIDVLVTAMKGRDISPQFNNLIFQLEQNKATIELLVSETIDVWHAVSGLCQGCCNKKKMRVRKSIVERPDLEMVSVASSPRKVEGVSEFIKTTYV